MSRSDEISQLRAAFSNTHQDEPGERIAAIEYDIAREIDERNGWDENGELDTRSRALMFQMASMLLRRVAEFVTHQTKCDTQRSCEILSKRNMAWIWVLFPDLVLNGEGRPATLQEVGEIYGNTRCWISMLAEEFSREFNYLSRNQKTLESRPVYAAAAKKGWVKRRAKSKKSKTTS